MRYLVYIKQILIIMILIESKRYRDSEVKIYIEDYMLSEASAIRWLGEHNHLKSRD